MAESKHIALVVEDEPHFAAQIIERLEDFDIRCVHVTNAQDAKLRIDEGRFCFMILDLQSKRKPDSIDPDVETGLSILEYVRQRNQGINDRYKHFLQVLVMSGHARDIHYVERSMQEGADAFIVKPLSDNVPPFRDKVRLALRHSGRDGKDGHDRCEAINDLAQAARASTRSPEKPPAPGEPIELAISGKEKGKKSEVTLAGQRLLLPQVLFILLLRLAAARSSDSDGWVFRDDIDKDLARGWNKIRRLRVELGVILPERQIIENNDEGSYRLGEAIHPAVDWKKLGTHSSGVAQEIAAGVRKRTRS